MRFVDTNVPIYAVSTAAEESEKRRRALEVLARPDLALSVQVLQEFYVQATCPSRPGALSHDAAISFIETLKRFPVQAVTLELMQAAFDIRERFGCPIGTVPFWQQPDCKDARSSTRKT